MQFIDITSDSLRSKGYRLTKQNSHIMTYANGSNIPWITKIVKQDFPKTTNNLEKKLQDKGVDQLTISEIESCMADNFNVIMSGNGKNADTATENDSSSPTAETPMEKLEKYNI